MVGGTPTQGYEPRASGPAFSGVTRDRLNAATAARPIAAGTPTQGYEPNLPPVAAGTPTGGYDSITSGTGGANRGGPAPDLYSGVFTPSDLGLGGMSPAAAVAAPASTSPNPFASIGDFFSPPSQAAVDRMAGGYGIAPPVNSSLGFLEAGGASHSALPSYGLPRPPQARPAGGAPFQGNLPQYRPSVPGANPRPQQSGDITGPSNIPPPAFGGNMPQARPDVGINPFGFSNPYPQGPRIPQSRPDPWSDWYDRMGGYG